MAIITSFAPSLINFRGHLIRALVERGVHVDALAPDYEQVTRRAVESLGAMPVDYSLSRTGMNPVRDSMDIVRLARTLAELRPDAILAYSIKPVLYSSLAGRMARVPRHFALIAGLGYVFTLSGAREAWWRAGLREGVKLLYAYALRRSERVFFQNADDATEFIASGIVNPEQVVRVAGTGVDLSYFAPAPPIRDPVTFVWVGRMLREKGIYEFVEAARLVRAQCPSARFVLLGRPDSNPGSLRESQVREWVDEGVVDWPGEVRDVRPWIRDSSVFVLPSYREGKPRSTQEAMAMGRAVITTDVPGCRETVEHGRNGFLVPARDSVALARAMYRFIQQPELMVRMGLESRRMAERMFDVHAINRKMLAAMGVGVDT